MCLLFLLGSFCHLHAKFGVIVLGKGVVEDPNTPVLRISLGTFAGVTCSLLIISYFVYRRYHIHELELELQSKQDFLLFIPNGRLLKYFFKLHNL